MGRKKIRCNNKLCAVYNKERTPTRISEHCEYCGKNSIEITGEIEEPKGYVLPERLQKIKNNLQRFKIENKEREILSIFLQYDLGEGLHKNEIFRRFISKYREKENVPFNVWKTLEEMSEKGIVIYEYEYLKDISNSIFEYYYERIPEEFEKLIPEFYYMCHIDDIPSILEKGILCYNKSYRISHKSLADEDVQEIREDRKVGGLSIHDYANLYFAKKTPMHYKRKNLQRGICHVCVDKNVLLLPDVYFSDGNAASKETEFYCDLKELKKISWECIDPEVRYYLGAGKRKKQAEVLVPHRVPPNNFQKIVVYDENAIEGIKEKIQKDVPIVVDKSFYF